MFEKAKTNDEVLRLIRLREEAQSEVATRIAEARKEEQTKADAEKRESAKKMLSKGLSVEDISDFTGLSIEEINEIKKKMKPWMN